MAGRLIDSATLRARPSIAAAGHPVSVVGKLSPDTLSLEELIGLAPDLVVTTAFMTQLDEANSLVERLKRFGIPVVFSDASSNTAAGEQATHPVAELKASMRMWGTLLGAAAKADAFTSFFERELAGITARLSGTKPVTTYLTSSPHSTIAAGQRAVRFGAICWRWPVVNPSLA